ncbi:MAG: DNA-directed DNA polymerase II small subunit [Archaeoglobales archaeon]|nr:MAG: DNA-directed DNA polymerase II small subunit [Archaeoglobales archaeon]
MVIKDIDSKLIITKFAMYGYNVHPSAVEVLKSLAPSKLDGVIAEVCRLANGSFIITAEDILPILDAIKSCEKKVESQKVKSSPSLQPVSELDSGRVNIVKDITGNSCCEGSVEDFVAYFNSRYEKLSRLLRNRVNPIPISSVGKVRAEKVEVIGMVNDVRETASGNAIVELEDKTGFINVIASGKLKEVAMELLGDEVIGVSGILKGRNLIADRIVFPDVPMNGVKRNWGFGVAFTSDTHFGSDAFIEDAWNRFVSWLNCEIGDERSQNLAESVKYVVIAGDIVDGIGIYPGQEKELAIVDIYQQYEEAAYQLDKLPKRVKIILSPGNHDAVRQAEPQPCLLKEHASLFSNNVIHVGNPALVDVEGVKILIYHGRSLDDLVTKIPRLSYEEPTKAMEELLKRRHLAPSYGNRSPIAPEKEDYLVIDEVPDVLHSGHIHTYGTSFYRGVFLVNSSCWQSQTEFQRKMNLNPTPGIVSVYNGNSVSKLKFC